MKRKLSRRNFLTDAAAAALYLPAVDTVFNSLLSSALRPRTAHAAAPFKSFIHLNLHSAPPRWMYDLFLNPANDASKFVPSTGVANIYTGSGGNYTNVGYRLIRHAASGHYVPHFWGFDLPTPTSSMVSASTLLNSMMNIRGIDVFSGSHSGAAALHQAGVQGANTISSRTADEATLDTAQPTQNLIRSIVLNPSVGNIFKSGKGLSQFSYDVTGLNDFARMFQSFQPVSAGNGFTATFSNNRAALQDKIDAGFNSLSPSAKKYYQNLLESSDSSLKILAGTTVDTFSQLSTDWTNLFGKYQSLIKKVLQTTYPGINDKPIGEVASGPTAGIYQFGPGNIMQNTVNGQIDLRNMMVQANGDILAAQFAVIEFLATRKISPSINVLIQPFQRLMANTTLDGMPFDQHTFGSMVGVQVNFIYFAAFTSCLLELIRVLKSANLFNDTLIYMNSEFNRSALANGFGSDHGSTAAHVSLLSGRISSFKLIGNIYKDSAPTNPNYTGTWGAGAPFVDGIPLEIVAVWGSVMNLLGVSSASLPSAVKKYKLLFAGPGDMTLNSVYDQTPLNVDNVR